MTQKIIFFFTLFLTTFCYSKTIEQGWNTLRGTIGKSNIVVNIYCDSLGNLKGDYCYQKFENRITLKGKLKGNSLFLDELIDGKINAKFNGKIDEKKNTITGKWSSTKNSDIPFNLRLDSWTGNSFNKRYSIGETNEAVEVFFKKIKQAIITDDKKWLSKNIEFPLTLYNNGKVKLKIKNAKDFLSKYTHVITKPLKKTMQETCICNIFSNWRGAMIANGFVWINEYDNGLKISAINNQ